MSVLDEILAAKTEEVERLKPRAKELRAAADRQQPPRPFRSALRAGNNVALIAEFKRRSPSAGWIRQNGSVAEITTAYNEFGARAISVLTDEKFFGGTMGDLQMARAKTSVPVLRKDFVIDVLQLVEARAHGADAALLIVRALDDAKFRDLLQAAAELGIGVLAETHNEHEVERALFAGCDVIGVNNRDLATFQVDHDLVGRISRSVPADVVLVAESGIKTVADVRRLADAGIDAVLVGETLMRNPELTKAMSNQPKVVRT